MAITLSPSPVAPAFPMDAAQVRQRVRDSILAIAELGMTESQIVLGPESDPATLGHKRFSVLSQSETNQGIFRDRSGRFIRIQQDITIRFSYQVRPNSSGDQLKDFDEAIGVVAPAIIRQLMAFLPKEHMPGADVRYVGTDRSLLHRGAWLIVDVQFGIQHNFEV